MSFPLFELLDGCCHECGDDGVTEPSKVVQQQDESIATNYEDDTTTTNYVASESQQPLQQSIQPGLFPDDVFTLKQDLRGAVFTNEEIIDEAFTWFRSVGFPYKSMPRFVMMQQVNALALTADESLANTNVAYSVADSFHPHRFHATVDGKVSPVQCFSDDTKFRHALALRLTYEGDIPAGFFSQLTLSRGTQQCSNFRPGFACLMYRRFCQPGATVLDTSTGYGGRLVGYVASRIGGTYIGIDPHTETHDCNIALARALGVFDRVTLVNAPVEDVDQHRFESMCDFSFTSPPYFSKEHYSSEDTQSWKRYGHSFDAWIAGFLTPMLRLTQVSLKPGAIAAVNIEDVNIKGKRYPLVQACIDVAIGIGFRHVANELFAIQRRLGAHQSDDVATERVLLFRKSDQ